MKTCSQGDAYFVSYQILAEIPGAAVAIGENRGLCSYYAETGGLLVGFEKR